MTRIGLISDTHSYLDPQVFTYFKEQDEIWHIGDFGSLEIWNQLKEFKPLRSVWGNIDGAPLRREMPELNCFQIEQVKVVLLHIGGYPGRYTPRAKQALKQEQPQLFISGHSHILKIMYDEQYQCLHMNPGAAGKEGWHQQRTLIRFSIDGTQIKDCEVIELGRRGQG